MSDPKVSVSKNGKWVITEMSIECDGIDITARHTKPRPRSLLRRMFWPLVAIAVVFLIGWVAL